MSYGPTPEEYSRLPGPARFVRDIAADLRVGKSVVVVFPDAVVESGIADAILDDLSAEGVRTANLQESTEPFPSRIISTFGSDPLNERAFDEWDRIIDWEPWHGSWIFVPGWQHKDVADVVDRWPPQLKASGLSFENRPKLIVAVRLAELPRATIAHLDQGDLGVHWWWGVLDRLDTETRLAAVSDRRFSPIDASVITEVSGWDLSCTEFLAAQWDRTTAGLPEAVHRYQQEAPRGPQSQLSATSGKRRGIHLPPAELEQHWRDGLVDRWAHSIRQAPNTLDDATVMQRLWMAHNRILISHVDEERSSYQRLIVSRASTASLDELHRRDEDSDLIEIGSLAWLVETRRVDIGRESKMRLQAFRDLRNDLAHCKPIADELLGRIIAYLEF